MKEVVRSMPNAVSAKETWTWVQGVQKEFTEMFFKKTNPPVQSIGANGGNLRPGAGPESTLVDVAAIGTEKYQAHTERRGKWIVYLAVAVFLFLIIGFSGAHTERLIRTARQSPVRVSMVPPEIDCVRVVSSPNSAVVDGAVDELNRVGFLGTVSIQSTVLDPESHKRGCFEAHREAHAWAVESGCTYTLVVEDDVVFAENMGAVWADIGALLQSGRPVDTVWLGYVGIRIDSILESPGIVALQKPMLAHAVVFSAETSRRIVGLPPWRPQKVSVLEAYDVALWHTGATRIGATFGVWPPAAAQLPSRAASNSLDKNGFQDWVKGFAGMKAFGLAASGRCSPVYQLSNFMAHVLSPITTFSPDAVSLNSVYTCDTVEDLSGT